MTLVIGRAPIGPRGTEILKAIARGDRLHVDGRTATLGGVRINHVMVLRLLLADAITLDGEEARLTGIGRAEAARDLG